jgi:hypothetical protein
MPETVGRFDSDPHLHSFHLVCWQKLLGSDTYLRAGTRQRENFPSRILRRRFSRVRDPLLPPDRQQFPLTVLKSHPVVPMYPKASV